MANNVSNVINDDIILVKLKQDFIRNKCDATLTPFLKCLRDSKVIVPMTLDMSEEDLAKMEGAADGESIELTDEVKLRPEILEGGDKKFFPVFTMDKYIPGDFADSHSLMTMPMIAALNMAHRIDGLSGIVIDAFSHSVGLPFALADRIYMLGDMDSQE